MKVEPEQAIVIPQEQEQSSEKHIGRINFLHRGHKVWKINLETGEVSEAEYEKDQSAVFSHEDKNPLIPIKRKIKTEEGFFYIAALNKKNAISKFVSYSKKVRDNG